MTSPKNIRRKKRKEMPILMGEPMVLALLNGSKTMTRRIAMVLPNGINELQPPDIDNLLKKCPYGKRGDLLWVRETFAKTPDIGITQNLYFRATDKEDKPSRVRWMPSIFMKKEYCRIWLQIKNVWIERLHDITKKGAVAEGIEKCGYLPQQKIDLWHDYLVKDARHINPVDSFETLWDSIHGEHKEKCWDSNPLVYVIQFKRLPEQGQLNL